MRKTKYIVNGKDDDELGNEADDGQDADDPLSLRQNKKNSSKSANNILKYDLPHYLRDFISEEKWDKMTVGQQKCCCTIMKSPNSYYFRTRPPWEPIKSGPFSAAEEEAFHERFEYFKNELGIVNKLWGYFAVPFKGRVGYQMSSFYRTQVKNKKIIDENFIDDNGNMRIRNPTKKRDLNQASIARLKEECNKYILEQIEKQHFTENDPLFEEIRSYRVSKKDLIVYNDYSVSDSNSDEFVPQENIEPKKHQSDQPDPIKSKKSAAKKQEENNDFESIVKKSKKRYITIDYSVNNEQHQQEIEKTEQNEQTKDNSEELPEIQEEFITNRNVDESDDEKMSNDEENDKNSINSEKTEQIPEDNQQNTDTTETKRVKRHYTRRRNKDADYILLDDQVFESDLSTESSDDNESDIKSLIANIRTRHVENGRKSMSLDPEDDEPCPLVGALDYVSHRPMRNPAMNQEGFVLDYQTWTQILNGQLPLPDGISIDSLSEIRVLTKANYAQYKMMITNFNSM